MSHVTPDQVRIAVLEALNRNPDIQGSEIDGVVARSLGVTIEDLRALIDKAFSREIRDIKRSHQ